MDELGNKTLAIVVQGGVVNKVVAGQSAAAVLKEAGIKVQIVDYDDDSEVPDGVDVWVDRVATAVPFN